jgi:transposase
MSFHLDYLLDLPGVKVETCTQIEGQIYFQLSVVASGIICPHCNNYTEELHQNRPILARDLSAFGRSVYLQVPRRQFYCPTCQRYSTEKLEFLDKKRRHTQRYEHNIYARVQQSSVSQIGREEELSYDEIKGIFSDVHSGKKKAVGSQLSE